MMEEIMIYLESYGINTDKMTTEQMLDMMDEIHEPNYEEEY